MWTVLSSFTDHDIGVRIPKRGHAPWNCGAAPEACPGRELRRAREGRS